MVLIAVGLRSIRGRMVIMEVHLRVGRWAGNCVCVCAHACVCEHGGKGLKIVSDDSVSYFVMLNSKSVIWDYAI